MANTDPDQPKYKTRLAAAKDNAATLRDQLNTLNQIEDVTGAIRHLFQKKVHHIIIVLRTVIIKSNMKRTRDSAGRMCPE